MASSPVAAQSIALPISFRQALSRLRLVHQQWNDKLPPADDWWAAAKTVIVEFSATVAKGVLADDHLHLAEPIAKMARGFFLPRLDREKHPVEGMPSRELCDGINATLAATPRAWPKLETVHVLHKQGVSVPQIAKMHGLAIDVAQEVIDGAPYPPGHVTPHVRDQASTKRKMRETLKLALGAWEVEMRAQNERKGVDQEQYDDGETTPEMLARGALHEEIRASRSIRQTLLDGVECAKAAVIYEVDPESVIQEAKNLGLEPVVAVAASRANGDTEKPAVPEAIDADILSMHEQGADKPTIAEATGTSVQKVANVIAGYERRMKKMNQGQQALAGS